MRVVRDYEGEQEINNQTNAFVGGDTNRRAKEVHASDLLWCIRQSYYKKMNPIKLTQYELLRFFKGKISEYAIGRFIYKASHWLQQAEIEKDGIMAHPDVLSHEENTVIELKQTDKEFGFVDPRDDLYNSFISYSTQLLYYLYLSGKEKGVVLVNHGNYEKIMKLLKNKEIAEKDATPFRMWNIFLEEGDLELVGKDISFKKKLLEDAIAHENVSYLPKLVNVDINDTSKCNKCAYREVCDKDPDFWERARYEKIMQDRSKRFGIPIQQLTITTEDFKHFKENYLGQDIQKTSSSWLWKNMKKTFESLGEYYKVEFTKKKK